MLVISLTLSALSTTPAEDTWGTEPLGMAFPPTDPIAPSGTNRSTPNFFKENIQGGPAWMSSLRDLERSMVVVGSQNPNNRAHRAAQMLQTELQRISGIEVPLISENKAARAKDAAGSPGWVGPDGQWRDRVFWVGASAISESAGILPGEMAIGGYQILVTEDGMILSGNDIHDAGTSHAVVSLLERRLGIRWLWPGELGTVTPPAEAFHLPRFEESDRPALACRTMRFMAWIEGRSEIGLQLAGIKEDRNAYLARLGGGLNAWPERQRLGGDCRMRGGHSFHGWYEKFGQAHPEWFALQPDGTRHQIGSRERLCVSNAELAEQVAQSRLEMLSTQPDVVLPLAPNDGGSTNFFCMCVDCRKLDPINGPPAELLFGRGPGRRERFTVDYVSLSDRYATFFNRVAEQVLAVHPQARFTTYAYHVYRDAPLRESLNPAITVGFVGLSYFNETERAKDLARWNAWAAKASSLYLRPNLLDSGRGFPSNFTSELGKDLEHLYRTGMVGADFDVAVHDWATRGLNYYVLAKLLWNPCSPVEPIVDDYCHAGFGPAAAQVRQYFNGLAIATAEVARKMGTFATEMREEEVGVPLPPVREQMQRSLLAVYDKKRLDSLSQQLNEARTAAGDNELVRQRIDFLARGLEYARFQVASYAAEYEGGDLRQAMRDLLDFLSKTAREEPLAINVPHHLHSQSARFRQLP
jgi:hypothetical protein